MMHPCASKLEFCLSSILRGHSFFSANAELLEIYSKCSTAVEVIAEQNRWLEGGPARMIPWLSHVSNDDDGEGEKEGDEDEDEDYRRRANRELPPTDSDDEEEEDLIRTTSGELALKLESSAGL